MDVEMKGLITGRCGRCVYGVWVLEDGRVMDRVRCKHPMHPGIMGVQGTEWALNCTDFSLAEEGVMEPEDRERLERNSLAGLTLGREGTLDMVERLVKLAVWFQVEPLPGERWFFQVKAIDRLAFLHTPLVYFEVGKVEP